MTMDDAIRRAAGYGTPGEALAAYRRDARSFDDLIRGAAGHPVASAEPPATSFDGGVRGGAHQDVDAGAQAEVLLRRALMERRS